MMVKVAEFRALDSEGAKSLSRFVLMPDGRVEVVGIAKNGKDGALAYTSRGIYGPKGRIVKMDEGLTFLELLHQNFLGSQFWATPVFEMELAAALRGSQEVSEGPKVVTLSETTGHLMVSADLHGNWDDFEWLRQWFLDAEARGEHPVWVSVGDWVHGPSSDRPPVLSRAGEALYDYPDRSVEIVRALFALMDRFPGRVISLLGNHEHAHIGGRRTSKFHEDESAFLEGQLTEEEVQNMRTRFAQWPLCVRVPGCGVVITHGAMAPGFENVTDLERISYRSPDANLPDVLSSAMSHYGFSQGEDLELLRKLRDVGGPSYEIIVHGHDREESGYGRTGERALLLCSSFGAIRARKAFLWLDLSKRYSSLDELQEGREIRFLWA